MTTRCVRSLTDLTEAQWRYLEPLLPRAKRRGRPRTPLRQVVAAILYVVKAGCQWRLLPPNFPPWQTVYHHFRGWSRAGSLTALNHRLRAFVRAAVGKRSRPTAAVLDSQTVRSDPHGGTVGYDAGKQTKGRKRCLLVDTLGLVLGAAVAPANTPERAGAQALLEPLLPYFPWVRQHRPKLVVEVIKRTDALAGLRVLPKRWVVERTLAWLTQQRRLVRDYERSEASATAWIYVALIRIMLRRLA